MFDSLSKQLTSVFQKIKGKGLLKESDVNEALREVRIALLEADVALPVAKTLIENIREKAVGKEVLEAVSPGQMVIKIVHDELVNIMGKENAELNFKSAPPASILLLGLQGSGKTTTTAKLAHHIQQFHKKKVIMASLDIHRPAAQQQLATLGDQNNIAHLPIVFGQTPPEIAKRAMETARLEGYDIVLLDTAGRLHIDDELMLELQDIANIAQPTESILVADAMTGQDAVEIAQHFSDKISLTGLVLTRIDGDARGGAALSLKHVTQCPIKFMGVGEKISDLEKFYPERIANRILDKGDVVSLVEKASEQIEQDEAEALAKKMQKGQFTLEDYTKQLDQLQKMGGMGSILKMLPGVGKLKKALSQAQIDEKVFVRQKAIISSMTPKERTYPEIIKASRKKRIAAGSGTQVQEINKLIKQFSEMNKMMKKFGKMDKSKLKNMNFENMFGQPRF